MLEAIYRALAGATPRPWWLRQRSQRRARGARERSSPLRSRQRVLSPLARPRDGLHVRVFPDAGRHARGGADREDGSRLPEAAAEAGRARRRSRLRLGRARAVHGAALRRHGPRVQHLAEQIAYARERATREGLADRVEFVEDDYRNVTRHTATRSCRSACSSTSACRTIPTLGQRDRSLAGRRTAAACCTSSAATSRRRSTRGSASGSFPARIRRRLREVFEHVLEPHDFSVLDVENLRLHYAKTLEHWRQRFDGAGRRGGGDVRRALRPRVAAVSRRLAGGVHDRHRCSCSRSCSRAAQQRDSVDARPAADGSPTMDTCDVLIVGGGPAGSTCAWTLRQAGLDVVVIDRATFPARQGLRRLDHAAGRRRAASSIPTTYRQRPDVPADHRLPRRADRRRSRRSRRATTVRSASASAAASSTTTCCERSGARLRARRRRVEPCVRDDAATGSSTARSARRCWSAPAVTSARWRDAINRRPPGASGRSSSRRRPSSRIDPPTIGGVRRPRRERAGAVLLPRSERLRLVLSQGQLPQHRPRPPRSPVAAARDRRSSSRSSNATGRLQPSRRRRWHGHAYLVSAPVARRVD